MKDYQETLLYKRIKEVSDNMAESGIEKLLSSCSKKTISKGSNILIQGQICSRIFFVEKGYLRIFLERDGAEINTDFVFEGSFTTSLKSLRNTIPSDVSIQAGEEAVIYSFVKDKLLTLYRESPEIESFGRKILELILIAQEEHSNLFKIYSPKQRYHYLLENKPHIIERISLSQISSYLGIARETLSRIRKIK